MVAPDRLGAFAALAFLLIVVPGPSVLFTIGRALAHGRRTALITVVGNAIGAFLLVGAVALGVGAVVERSVLALAVLKYLGAAYLVYLGVKAIRDRGSLKAVLADIDVGKDRGWRRLWDGFVVGLTNPKTILFFVAVLPQFVDQGRGQAALQMLVFGLVFCLIALMSDSVWGMAAATARDWFARSPQRLAVVGGAGGLAMIGLGVGVAVSGRKD
jgi:threonine/homoserine/homoserine lactone efflux protein